MVAKFYDIKDLLPYEADITIVIGARGMGKTYSTRRYMVEDYIRHGIRFAEIVRSDKEIRRITSGYFDKLVLNKEFKDYEFKATGHTMYVRMKKKKKEKKNTHEWRIMGYFAALTMQQQLKKATYLNVRNILMDEILIDINDRYHRYLTNEWEQIANLVDTLTRENVNDVSLRKPRIFMLGNSCDLYNPIFEHYGINEIPEYGRHWFGNKTCLLDYVRDDEYSREKVLNTVAGRMLGTSDSDISARNEFRVLSEEFIMKPHAHAKLTYIIRYKSTDYGILLDMICGMVFITEKFDRSLHAYRFALTTQDNKLNYMAAQSSREMVKSIIEYYSIGCLRYDSRVTERNMLDILKLFGVK